MMLGQHQRSAPVVSSPAPGGCAGPATMGFARSSNGFVVPVANEEFQQHEDTKYYDALNKSGGSGGAGAGGDKSYYYGGGDPNGESRRRSRSRGSSSRQQTFEGGGGLFRPPEEDEGEASASRRLVASRDFDESAATAGKTNFYYRELQEQQEQSWRDRDERRRRRLHVVEQQKQQQRQPEYSLSTSVSSHLQAIRYQLEHNQIYRLDLESKLQLFEILSEHLAWSSSGSVDGSSSGVVNVQDWEVRNATLGLIKDILPHLGPDTDPCMGLVLPQVVPCLGCTRISVRRTALAVLRIHLRFASDVQAVLRCLVRHGLESQDPRVIHETLLSLPILFSPEEYDSRYGRGSLYVLVSGVSRRLLPEETRHAAFMSLQKIAETVGQAHFASYLDKIHIEERKIYEQLVFARGGGGGGAAAATAAIMGNGVSVAPSGVVGRKVKGSAEVNSNWVEYGAIDDAIIQKLRDDEDAQTRLEGAEELNRAIRDMPDLTVLLPQLRLFLNFLDSLLEERNFKVNILILEVYGMIVTRLKTRIKPHLRLVCSSLLRHCSHSKTVVRIENHRVIKALMSVAKPNSVLEHLTDHLGDRRSAVRESVLALVCLALLTFPSYEFDLRGLAASTVPALSDPKRRVRRAALECMAVLSAFLGPARSAGPLMRSVELLESSAGPGSTSGAVEAVRARLARRTLPRVTPEGLVEYAVPIPQTARQEGQTFGADIEYILAGSGSLGSGSAKSVSTQRSESRLEDSFSSAASFPNSPNNNNNNNSTSKNKNNADNTNPNNIVAGRGIASSRSRSQEALNSSLSRPFSRQNSSGQKPQQLKLGGGGGPGEVTPSNNPSSRSQSQKRGRPSSQQRTSMSLPRAISGKGSAASNNKSAAMKLYRDSDLDLSGLGEELEEANVGEHLPRITGTKSQASTASSSATRDSGISLSDKTRAAAAAATAAAAAVTALKTEPAAIDSSPRKSSSRLSNQPLHSQISFDDMPVNGLAVNLLNRSSVTSGRPGTNKASGMSSGNIEEQQRTLSRLSSKYSAARVSPERLAHNRAHPYHADDELEYSRENMEQEHAKEVTPPRSPVAAQQLPLLLRGSAAPGGGGPFNPLQHPPEQQRPRPPGGFAAISSNLSVAATSVPSSYEYEDDFTSDEDDVATVADGFSSEKKKRPKSHRTEAAAAAKSPEFQSAQSQRTIGSTTSAGSSLSRIPIKRNSSMRRNKHIMENYKTNSGEEDDDDVDDEDFDHREEGNRDAKRNSHPRRQLSNRQRSPAALRRRQQQQPKVPKDPSSRSLERGQTSRRVSGRTGGISLSKSIGALNGVDRDATVAAPSDNPFQTSSMVKNSPVMPRRSQKPRTAQKDELREDGDQGESDRHTMDDGTKIESVTSGLSSASGEENIPPNSTSSQSNEIPPEPPSSAPPPKEESQVPVAPRAQTVAGDASRLSTANSTVSTGSYLNLPLKTQVTLKSPFEEANLGPPPSPADAFLSKSMGEMANTTDWESNLRGMTGVIRLARHQPDYLLVEIKQLLALVLKQVKNLRSQVCRAGAHTMAELFLHLKRNLESDLEKMAVPLIHKTGDTNKFLREDCHVALDAMVENLSPSRVVSVLTSEVMLHKNPTVRGTVSRLLAYVTDRVGPDKVLSGQKDLTDKILPAVAKLAQDGSQEARTYAKATLVSFLDCGVDWERALKKNLTQNTMRSLDKVLEALKGGGGGGGMISSSSSVASKGRSGHSTLSRRPLRAKRRALSRKTL